MVYLDQKAHKKGICRYIYADIKQPDGSFKKTRLKTLGYISEDLAKSKLKKYKSSTNNKPIPNLLFSTIIKSYLEDLKETAKPGSYKREQSTCKRIEKYLGILESTEIDFNAIDRFIKHIRQEIIKEKAGNVKRLTPRGINITIMVLKKILRYGANKGWIVNVPAISGDKDPALNRRIVFLTEDEVNKMLDKANDSLRFYITLMVHTGMRPEEANRLKWSDINFAQDYIHIYNERANKATRTIKIPPKIREYLLMQRSFAESERVSPYSEKTNPTQFIYRLCESLGINKGSLINAYTLRKTFITWCAQKGKDMFKVAQACGTSVKMIEKYYAQLDHDFTSEVFD